MKTGDPEARDAKLSDARSRFRTTAGMRSQLNLAPAAAVLKAKVEAIVV